MNFSTVLDKRIVDLDMNVKNKDEALSHLSKLLLDAGYIGDIDSFKEDIYLREQEGMTGIGSYVAIPHGKSDSVQKIGIAIGKLSNEIEWETIDGKGVKIIFLFAVSNNTDYAKNHMKLLSEIARNLGNDTKVDQLLHIDTFDQLVNLFE